MELLYFNIRYKDFHSQKAIYRDDRFSYFYHRNYTNCTSSVSANNKSSIVLSNGRTLQTVQFLLLLITAAYNKNFQEYSSISSSYRSDTFTTLSLLLLQPERENILRTNSDGINERVFVRW